MSKLNLVFLPATEPDDETYGVIPGELAGYPDVSIRQVHYTSLVWYNESVCREAVAQIRSWGIGGVVLVGFSKSGLGAWNIARALPDIVAATIIFDAPVARDELPSWGTSPFYADDAQWQADLPLRTMGEYTAVLPAPHRLVLISGEGFRDEMCALSRALSQRAYEHTLLDRPSMKHHWNAGWVEEGMAAVVGPID